MKTLALFVLPAVLLGACAGRTTTNTFDVDPSVADEIVLATESAAAEWCAKSNGAHCLELRYGDPCWGDDSCQATVRQVAALDNGEQASAELHVQSHTEELRVRSTPEFRARANAMCADLGVTLAPDGTCWTAYLHREILHEIGHHFCGPQHDSRLGHILSLATETQPEVLSIEDATCPTYDW